MAARRVRAESVRAALVGIVAVGAVLVPLRPVRDQDSFPLSNYPMFTAKRGEVTSVERAVGVAPDGSEHALSPELIGGTVEVIQAAQTIVDAIRAGSADELCAEIASRVADASDNDTSEVLVLTERYDVVSALRSDSPRPVEREVHARCEAGR